MKSKKIKLFIIPLICLLVIYVGWITYNQMNPTVMVTHARYKYHFDNVSQIAEKAEEVVKVKVLGDSKNIIKNYVDDIPSFGYTKTKIEIKKIYKSTDLTEKQIIDFIEPYFSYTQPLTGKKYIVPFENYKPMETGKSYILFLRTYKHNDPDRVGAYEPIQCEYGKYRINEKFDESIDTNSLTVDDYDIYSHNSDYEKLFREIMKKYK